jgi:hypothetical protein
MLVYFLNMFRVLLLLLLLLLKNGEKINQHFVASSWLFILYYLRCTVTRTSNGASLSFDGLHAAEDRDIWPTVIYVFKWHIYLFI